MIIGIVGSEAAKFTAETEAKAREIIRSLLSPADAILCSGHCQLGGVDIFAEEEAQALGRFDPQYIFPPRQLNWTFGYKPRNLQIARESDVVYCLTLKELPPTYQGMRFEACYHCAGSDRPPHVKSGGCWTVLQAIKRGKPGEWRII